MTAPRLAQRFSPNSELHLPSDRVTVLGATNQFEAATLVCRTLYNVAEEAQDRRRRHFENVWKTYEEYIFYASKSVALGILHERARRPYGLPGTYRSTLVEEAWWAVGLPSELQTLDFRVWDEDARRSPSPATTAALTTEVFKLVRSRLATHLALANPGALRAYAEEVKHSPELLVPAGELHDGALDWTNVLVQHHLVLEPDLILGSRDTSSPPPPRDAMRIGIPRTGQDAAPFSTVNFTGAIVIVLPLVDVLAYELEIVWQGFDFRVRSQGQSRAARKDAACVAVFNVMLAWDLVDRLAAAQIDLETCDISKLALHVRELLDRMHNTHDLCGYRIFYDWVTDQLGERRRAEVAEDVVRFLQPFWPALGDERLYGEQTRGRNCRDVVAELCRALKMVHNLVRQSGALDNVKMLHLRVADPPSRSCRGKITLFLPQLFLSVVATAPEAKRTSAIYRVVKHTARMATDSYSHTFTWKGHGSTIVATGTFDDWKCSLPPLTKQADGSFAGHVQLPFGKKVLYKYVVDGQWMPNHDEPTETDFSGNVNNVLHVPEHIAVVENVSSGTDTSAVLPVPSSSVTVAGDVSSTAPATTSSTATNTSNAPATVTEQAKERAAQVQTTATDLATQAQTKVQEVAPQVQEKAKELAGKTQETVGPAAATLGAAVVATAGAAAAGLASLASSATETTTEALAQAPSAAKELSAQASSAASTAQAKVQESASQVAQEAHTTAVVAKDNGPQSTADAPKYNEHTAVVAKEPAPVAPTVAGAAGPEAHSTAAAPKYDEHTAVVAKQEAPAAPSVPLGAGAEAHVTAAADKQAAEPEHKPVEGFVAPKEKPEDAPLIGAGIAAVGAAVAGVELLGHKVVEAVHPHAVHAQQAGSQTLQDAAHTAEQYLDHTRQETEKLAHQTYEQAQHQAVNVKEKLFEALHLGKKKAAETSKRASTVLPASAAASVGATSGVPDKEITPLPVSEAPGSGASTVPDQVVTKLPASEAPVATDKPDPHPPVSKAVVPTSTSTGAASSSAEAPTLPDKDITPITPLEAPVALQQGSNAVPTAYNAVAPASTRSTSAPAPAPARSSPLPPPPLQPLPPSPAPAPAASSPSAHVSTGTTPALAPPVAPIEPAPVSTKAVAVGPTTTAQPGTTAPTSTAPASTPATPQKAEQFTTAPTTPASTLGKQAGRQALGAASGRDESPSPSINSGKEKRKSFFSRVFSSSGKKGKE
ncbi:Cruciform DNA binding protein [Rhodotorula toruloides]